jgi:ELWxxDGT repeat protein
MTHKYRLGLFGTTVLLCSTLATAQVALLADLNTGPNFPQGSGAQQFLPVSAVKTYFTTCDDEAGCELWKTDGSTVGTVRITDICPGACSSSPLALTLVGGTVYMSANDGQRGEELWQVNTSTDTASLIQDIRVGPASSSPRNFTAANNVDNLPFVYFSILGVNEQSGRTHVGRVNAAGSIAQTDTGFVWSESNNWVAYNGAIYGVAAPIASTGDAELTKLNLLIFVVTASTVKDIEPGANGSRIERLFVGLSPAKLLFAARSLATGRELYSSDGTSVGTAIIEEQSTGAGDSFCNLGITTANNLAYFSARVSAASGCELHRTDGTTAGTMLVKDIFPGNTGSDPSNIRLLGSNLIFTAIDSAATGRELWKSDGTAAGTVLIRDLIVGAGGILFHLPSTSASQPALIISGFYYVLSDTGRLYRTDGSSVGTREVGTLLGTDDSRRQLSHANGVMLYNTANFVGAGSFGREPVRAPINSPGTNELLKNIGSDIGNSFPYPFIDFNGRAVFAAAVSSNLPLIHITNPSGLPTVINPSFVNGPTFASGNRLYMRDYSRLNISDGSVAGLTTLSTDFNVLEETLPTAFGAYVLAKTRDIDGNGRPDFSDGIDLWRTDGTEAGTIKLTSRTTLADTFYIDRDFALIGNDVLIVGSDSNTFNSAGEELYRINVNTGLATLVRDIAPGIASFSQSNFLQVGATVYFTARDGSSNEELWKTDGTAQGTVQVTDINTTGGSFPRELVKIGNTVYFSAFNPNNGRDIYQTDGVTTTLAANFSSVAPNDTVTENTPLVVSGNRVYFASMSPTDNGSRVYFTTGNVASMQQVGGITPGATGNAPQQIIAGSAPGSVVFSGWDASNGRELWYSDGTDAGTRRISNIAAGTGSGSPTDLALVGNKIYFSASDQVIGREPYVLDLSQLDRFFSNGFE